MKPRKLLKTLRKVSASTLKTTGKMTLRAGNFAVSTLQNLDNTAKALIVSRFPKEIKEAIKKGKIAIPGSAIRTTLREYLSRKKVTLVDLFIQVDKCLVVAKTKKNGITVKAEVSLGIEELEVQFADSDLTTNNLSEVNLKLIVLEPLKISGEGFLGVPCIWIVEKIGRGIFGINPLPQNLRDFQVAGRIITLPIKMIDIDFNQSWQNYLKYVQFVVQFIKEVKLVDNAVEMILDPPQWMLEMLTEAEESPPV